MDPTYIHPVCAALDRISLSRDELQSFLSKVLALGLHGFCTLQGDLLAHLTDTTGACTILVEHVPQELTLQHIDQRGFGALSKPEVCALEAELAHQQAAGGLKPITAHELWLTAHRLAHLNECLMLHVQPMLSQSVLPGSVQAEEWQARILHALHIPIATPEAVASISAGLAPLDSALLQQTAQTWLNQAPQLIQAAAAAAAAAATATAAIAAAATTAAGHKAALAAEPAQNAASARTLSLAQPLQAPIGNAGLSGLACMEGLQQGHVQSHSGMAVAAQQGQQLPMQEHGHRQQPAWAVQQQGHVQQAGTAVQAVLAIQPGHVQQQAGMAQQLVLPLTAEALPPQLLQQLMQPGVLQQLLQQHQAVAALAACNRTAMDPNVQEKRIGTHQAIQEAPAFMSDLRVCAEHQAAAPSAGQSGPASTCASTIMPEVAYPKAVEAKPLGADASPVVSQLPCAMHEPTLADSGSGGGLQQPLPASRSEQKGQERSQGAQQQQQRRSSSSKGNDRHSRLKHRYASSPDGTHVAAPSASRKHSRSHSRDQEHGRYAKPNRASPRHHSLSPEPSPHRPRAARSPSHQHRPHGEQYRGALPQRGRRSPDRRRVKSASLPRHPSLESRRAHARAPEPTPGPPPLHMQGGWDLPLGAFSSAEEEAAAFIKGLHRYLLEYPEGRPMTAACNAGWAVPWRLLQGAAPSVWISTHGEDCIVVVDGQHASVLVAQENYPAWLAQRLRPVKGLVQPQPSLKPAKHARSIEPVHQQRHQRTDADRAVDHEDDQLAGLSCHTQHTTDGGQQLPPPPPLLGRSPYPAHSNSRPEAIPDATPGSKWGTELTSSSAPPMSPQCTEEGWNPSPGAFKNRDEEAAAFIQGLHHYLLAYPGGRPTSGACHDGWAVPQYLLQGMGPARWLSMYGNGCISVVDCYNATVLVAQEHFLAWLEQRGQQRVAVVRNEELKESSCTAKSREGDMCKRSSSLQDTLHEKKVSAAEGGQGNVQQQRKHQYQQQHPQQEQQQEQRQKQQQEQQQLTTPAGLAAAAGDMPLSSTLRLEGGWPSRSQQFASASIMQAQYAVDLQSMLRQHAMDVKQPTAAGSTRRNAGDDGRGSNGVPLGELERQGWGVPGIASGLASVAWLFRHSTLFSLQQATANDSQDVVVCALVEENPQRGEAVSNAEQDHVQEQQLQQEERQKQRLEQLLEQQLGTQQEWRDLGHAHVAVKNGQAGSRGTDRPNGGSQNSQAPASNYAPVQPQDEGQHADQQQHSKRGLSSSPSRGSSKRQTPRPLAFKPQSQISAYGGGGGNDGIPGSHASAIRDRLSRPSQDKPQGAVKGASKKAAAPAAASTASHGWRPAAGGYPSQQAEELAFMRALHAYMMEHCPGGEDLPTLRRGGWAVPEHLLWGMSPASWFKGAKAFFSISRGPGDKPIIIPLSYPDYSPNWARDSHRKR